MTCFSIQCKGPRYWGGRGVALQETFFGIQPESHWFDLGQGQTRDDVMRPIAFPVNGGAIKAWLSR